jgi:hypothetical protein
MQFFFQAASKVFVQFRLPPITRRIPAGWKGMTSNPPSLLWPGFSNTAVSRPESEINPGIAHAIPCDLI